MPNRGRRNPRNLSRTRQGPAANALNTEQTNYRSMATEALRLLLAQHNLFQTALVNNSSPALKPTSKTLRQVGLPSPTRRLLPILYHKKS